MKCPPPYMRKPDAQERNGPRVPAVFLALPSGWTARFAPHSPLMTGNLNFEKLLQPQLQVRNGIVARQKFIYRHGFPILPLIAKDDIVQDMA